MTDNKQLNDKSSFFYEQAAIWDQTTEVYQKETLRDILTILPDDAHTILDVGCGDGFVTNRLPKDRDVTGLDISMEALSRVKCNTKQGSILELPFQKNSFDLVMCNDVLEHLTESERIRAIREISRVASQYVLLTTPILEKLEEGMVNCGECGERYHVNYHKASFFPWDHRGFFAKSLWKCQVQVLTGDRRKRLSFEQEILSILQKPDFKSLTYLRCPQCGSASIKSHSSNSELSSNEAGYMSAFLLHNMPEKVQTVRTECISLFAYNKKFKLPVGFYSSSFKPVEALSVTRSAGEIIFKEESVYRVSNLSSLATSSYYLNKYTQVGYGHILSQNSEILCSFMVKDVDHESRLSINGYAENDGRIFIEIYDGKQYIKFASFDVLKGEFSYDISALKAVFSCYGYLFCFRANIKILLHKIALGMNTNNVVVREIKDATYWRLPGEDLIILSLSLYGDYLLEEYWMHDIKQLKSNHQSFYIKKDNQQKSLLLQIKDMREIILSEKRQMEKDKKKQNLEYKLFGKIIGFFSDKLKSYHNFCQKLRDQASSLQRYATWEEQTYNKISYLMICHDQNIDRRIIQQAQTLQEKGWTGIIIALSHDLEDKIDYVGEIVVHRIGLKRIVPECPAYYKAMAFAKLLQEMPFQRLFNTLYRVSFLGFYGLLRLCYYGSIHGIPLPFDNAFYEAAKHYKASVVQAHDLPALKTAKDLAMEWNVPLVYDSHELYLEQKVFSKKQKAFMFAIEQKYITHTAVTFTVNKDIAIHLANRYKIPEPIEMFNAVTPPKNINKSGDLLRKYFSLSKDKFILLYQGGLSPYRNLEVLAKAMSMVTNPTLVLVFMGNGRLLNKLQNIVKKYNCADRVFFKEAVPQEELLYWTCTADVGIIPYSAIDMNTFYCNPNKMFEFIQAELPTLANDLPSFHRYIEQTGFGLVTDITKPGLAAKAFDKIADMPEFLGEARKKLAVDKVLYNWETQAEHYWKAISKLQCNPVRSCR